jgi:hypothetical protein
MTSVVGILNKQAVAIAADSAVTIGGHNSKKIFNKANKLFTLSKEHPVGIMIYNSASFMGTPWETIIKVYRKQLGDKSFPTVREYQNDFLEFIRSKQFYTTSKFQLDCLENFALNIINSIIEEVINQNPPLRQTADHQLFIQKVDEKADEFALRWNQTDLCSEFNDYTFDMFNTYSNSTFDNINQNRFVRNGINISSEVLLKLKKAVFSLLRIKEDRTSFTGLIFVGFGEDEIYPQLIPSIISMVIDNRLRYYIDESNVASISNDNIGAVRPFAQTDVIDTILSGIDPSLDNIYSNNFDLLFKKYNQAIIDSIGTSNNLLLQQIQSLDTDAIVREFNSLNQQIKHENYIIPLMNAVSNLAKEDLSEMAESLIYLTYLKRRITFAEESVGGPVDVAIISKGDGFVWIKRKHYFKPELNQHFFYNYFKK